MGAEPVAHHVPLALPSREEKKSLGDGMLIPDMLYSEVCDIGVISALDGRGGGVQSSSSISFSETVGDENSGWRSGLGERDCRVSSAPAGSWTPKSEHPPSDPRIGLSWYSPDVSMAKSRTPMLSSELGPDWLIHPHPSSIVIFSSGR